MTCKCEKPMGLFLRGLKVEMASGVSWRTPDANPMVDAKRCLECNTFFPLEDPAVDTELVKIEIRAHEIAFHDDIDDTLTDRERMGFIEGWDDRDEFLRYYQAADWAGWLAGVIHKHKIQTADPADVISLLRKETT